jgi:hypothetical protein
MRPFDFIVILALLLPSFFVARYAERKGQSFAAFLILGLLGSRVIL